MAVADRQAQRLGGLPAERLHVLLAARGLDQPHGGWQGKAPQRVYLAGRTLVHGDQAGVRPRVRGELRREPGDPGVEQPVDPGRRHLGRVGDGRGELVAVRREVQAVEARGAGERAAEEGRRVGHPGQGAADGARQPVTGPQQLGEHRAGHPERHRRLQRGRPCGLADVAPQAAEHLAEQRVAAAALRPVRVPGRGRGHDRQRRRRLHPRGERPGAGEPADAERGGTGDPGEQCVLAQRAGGRPGAAAGAEHPADPAQRAERVCQRHDLARAPDAGPWHGGHQPGAECVRQPLAQRGGHPGVPGQERAQPDGDQRPRVGLAQPRRPPGGPGQQQVALVFALLRHAEPDAGQRAHAGVHAVHRHARGEHGACLAAAVVHRPRQLGGERKPTPGGDLADQSRAEVSRLAQGAWRQLLVAFCRNRWPMAVG